MMGSTISSDTSVSLLFWRLSVSRELRFSNASPGSVSMLQQDSPTTALSRSIALGATAPLETSARSCAAAQDLTCAQIMQRRQSCLTRGATSPRSGSRFRDAWEMSMEYPQSYMLSSRPINLHSLTNESKLFVNQRSLFQRPINLVVTRLPDGVLSVADASDDLITHLSKIHHSPTTQAESSLVPECRICKMKMSNTCSLC